MAVHQQTFGEDDGKAEHDSFPSLESVLTSLNTSCGFNIEVANPYPHIELVKLLLLSQVKYGQTMRDGTEETKVLNPYIMTQQSTL